MNAIEERKQKRETTVQNLSDIDKRVKKKNQVIKTMRGCKF